MNVRELFRSNLENSEVIPSDAVREQLMRRLAVKKFLRFSPARFNVYYLGGIVAVTTTALFILTSKHPDSPRQNEKLDPQVTVSSGKVSSTEENMIIPNQTLSKNSVTNENSERKKPFVKGELTKERNDAENKAVDIVKDSSLIEKGLSKKEGVSSEDLSGKKNQIGLQRKIGAAFDVSAASGCSPLKVRFRNNSASFDSCVWVFGDGGSSNEKNPDWIFDVEGEYKVALTVFNSDGNQATANSVITVHSKPSARFEISPEKPVIPDDEIHFINYSVNAVKYKWDFGDGNTSNSFEPFHKYRKFNNYNVRLIAWSDYGCPDTLLVKNAFSVTGCFIDFPNAFIPGTDGPSGGYYSARTDESARIFHPVTSGVAEFHLKIFSKTGMLIFESNDINLGWDGYLKGQLCESGVYIWKVRGTYKNGEAFVKMGDLTLLKN